MKIDRNLNYDLQFLNSIEKCLSFKMKIFNFHYILFFQHLSIKTAIIYALSRGNDKYMEQPC